MTQPIVLTLDQQTALSKIHSFILDPIETVFVLSGFSGTGKSTLVRHVLDQLPVFLRAAQLIDPTTRDYQIELTATTNKAAETFGQLTNREVSTIHSYLGLRVEKDYSTGASRLVPKAGTLMENVLLFIDEASYVDAALLGYIFKLTKNCKVIFIGDPAQLTPVKSAGTPVFDAKFTGAHLSQVVRQAEGNPIVDLSTKFRNTVTTGDFFKFVPDGQVVIHLDRDSFNTAVHKEFTRADWKYQDSKILGWTNKCVIGYNRWVYDQIRSSSDFHVGDYAVCNKHITANRRTIKTDQLVRITNVSDPVIKYGVQGKNYYLDYDFLIFGPDSVDAKNELIKRSKAAGDYHIVEEIDTQWIDLRAAYACTINKAQGSTFDRVFIDLDDISRCNSGEQIARMLYVAVSRPRHQIFLTGDLV